MYQKIVADIESALDVKPMLLSELMEIEGMFAKEGETKYDFLLMDAVLQSNLSEEGVVALHVIFTEKRAAFSMNDAMQVIFMRRSLGNAISPENILWYLDPEMLEAAKKTGIPFIEIVSDTQD